MNVSQWHMNRLGLVDFWCYENDEFYFKDGHMLLRGSNGSGKSVTMQSFIPLLLDGNRSSERLDAFGSRSRTMDTYLINENTDRDERIAYLYLEFKRTESELYKTIGMGMRARRNKPLETWYFVIEDNQRVNIDFSLMENQLTLSRKQLENILGKQVLTGQNEYMRRVNEALFGFSSADDYKDAIDLLIQLRSPKLSNALSPTKINEILANSLQPLSEDDLRPMSDAITSMDNLQDELENLNTSFLAATKISQAYEVYNKAILVDKWNKYNRENDICKKLEREMQEKESQLSKMKEDYQSFHTKLSQDSIQLEIVKKEKDVLMDPQIEHLHDELTQSKQRFQELHQVIEQKENQCEKKEEKTIDLKNDIEKYENQVYESQKSQQKALKALDEVYETFPFSEQSALKESFVNQKQFDFDYTKRRLKEEQKETQELMNQWTQYDAKSQQIEIYENQIIQLDDQINEIKKRLIDAREKYQNCVVEYQEYFYHYAQHNEVLKLTQEDLTRMSQMLSDYEVNKDYHSLHTLVYSQYMKINEQLTKEKSIFNFDIHKTEIEYDEARQEYQEWLSKKDFDPQRDELTLQNRQTLLEQDIAYIPLFQLLDFDDAIEDDRKNTIEELLSQMHILDAIVVESQHRQQITQDHHQSHDYYLWTDLPLKDLKTVKINDSFDDKQLIQILKNLGIEASHDIELSEYYFRSGLLQGNISQQQQACFIGYERRQLLKQEKIETLYSLQESLQQKVELLKDKSQTLDKQLLLLKSEMDALRDETELKQSYDDIEKYQKEYQYGEEKLDHLIEQKNLENQEIQKLQHDIQDKCYKLLVDFSKTSIINRQDDITIYEENLDLLKDALQHHNQYQKLIDIEQEKLTELLQDVDDLNYEIETTKQQKEICDGHIHSLEKKLDSLGYADKQRRLEKIEADIVTYQEAIENYKTELTRLETQEEIELERLEVEQKNFIQQNNHKELYHDVLMQEVQYGFLIKDDEEVYKSLKHLGTQVKMSKSVSDYLTSLQSIFFEQAAYLSQYHLTHVVDKPCHELEDTSGHFIINANHQGKKIPFADLLNILNERIESQKLLIVEEDRQIFEEILVNTIGKKIRDHIQASKRWVDKMERYMHDMNTSSGLQLGLKWRNKKADDTDELDTQKLVELLEKDYRLLKDSDRQKISQHFRSKIESARRMSLDENTSASFHQLIKNVMDYRQWFEFTLYAQKPNENRKELTNRLFYSYSGGEKAIAMYVPLFSAVAAKFESARDDAPHLIALDEAFAGVDENNIDTLFALITKFNFDYIMNSQVLWGDYPSCKSLSIYELFRPNNANFVTKIAYVWNGHVRKVMM